MVPRAVFFFTFLSLITLAIVYMGRRSKRLCPRLAKTPTRVWGLLLVFLLLMLVAPFINRSLGYQLNCLYWPSYLLFSFLSTYLIYLLAADVIQFILCRFYSNKERIQLWSFRVAFYASILSVIAGLSTALAPPVLKHIQLPIAGLPKALHGFRILQISDLHLAPLVTEKSIHRLVSQVNAQKADMVAITGDLVDGSPDGVQSKAEILKAISSIHGTYFIPGNHEYYSGYFRWSQVFKDFGWRVLENECAVIEHRGAQLAIAGLPDPHSNHFIPDIRQALTTCPKDATKIVLYHPPTGYDAHEQAGVSLQLSGHTHSGQYFPWSLVVPFLYKYPSGLNRHGNLWIYTSVGTGFWGPPNRLFVPPELTIITLERQ